MLKVTLANKMVRVENPPFGNTTFNIDALIGMKKEEFEKRYKGKLDTKETWNAIKKFTK